MRIHGLACLSLVPRFAIAATTTCALPPPASAQQQETWAAGAYSFSDELGGFRITGVSGRGTHDDPVVVAEELYSATPVTLTIRTTKPIRPSDPSGDYANGILYLHLEVLNNSGLGWIEFEFELQEILGRRPVVRPTQPYPDEHRVQQFCRILTRFRAV